MATAVPSIVCLGVIGRNNNPLHLTILPSYNPPSTSSGPAKPTPLRTPLQFSLLLSSTLDIFEQRARQHAATGAGALSGDLGLLCAVDERLACYGYETNTGVRFVAVVDMRGRAVNLSGSASSAGAAAAGVGLRDADLKPLFRAMQTAYVRLLQNPFYDPDEHCPPNGRGGRSITSHKFGEDMRRLAEKWGVGITGFDGF